jgi:hypothetical protein
MKPTKLIEPDFSKIENIKWYEQYQQLNSALFTYQNSAKMMGEPYLFEIKDGKLKAIRFIEQSANEYAILGYTLNPPVAAPYEYVAIMFENNKTFEKVWFHYPLYL